MDHHESPRVWRNRSIDAQEWDGLFPEIESGAAAARIRGEVHRTAIVSLPKAAGDGPNQILGKMENRQVTGSFKARGALNNILMLSDEERARGVVASSSGNHGRALAWAAARAGVKATIVMPENAYPNKIEACRAEGAEVVLSPTREGADDTAAHLASAEGGSSVWVHPYDRMGTIEGAGTVGLEIAEDAGELDAVILCVGGGGLSAGSALAIRRARGGSVVIIGAEPSGAAAMAEGLSKGESVRLAHITSDVQGLTTPYAGHHNVAVNLAVLDGMVTLDDDAIYAAQRRLVNSDGVAGWEGEVVEPAGAAAFAAALDPRTDALIRSVLEGRGLPRPEDAPLRIAVTISGGNPDPAQLASLRP